MNAQPIVAGYAPNVHGAIAPRLSVNDTIRIRCYSPMAAKRVIEPGKHLKLRVPAAFYRAYAVANQICFVTGSCGNALRR